MNGKGIWISREGGGGVRKSESEVNGITYGHAEHYESNGSKYVGQWNGGVHEGQGIYTYPNGDTWEGNFHCWSKHGKGILTRASTGEKSEKEYKENKLVN